MAHATIKSGSSGAEVTTWQGLLTQAGFSVPVTATFDAATIAATKAWQSANGLTSDGIVGPASWSKMTGQSQVSPDPNAQYGRDAILAAWPEIITEGLASDKPEIRAIAQATQDPPLGLLQILGAEGHLESNYGKAGYTNKVTGAKSGVINNWGAVQAGAPPCNPDTSFEASDTHADGTPYTYCYKKYPTPAAGAKDMIRNFTIRRPTGWMLAAAGDIDAATVAWGKKDPITNVGLYYEQSASSRSKGIDQRVQSIAAALNEPVMAKRGGPVDQYPPSMPDGGGVSTDVPIDTDPTTPGVQPASQSKGIIALAIAGAAYFLWKYLK